MFAFIYKYRYYILGLLGLSHLLMFWPGLSMYDSMQQYHQALAGQYSPHHPPLMAMVWHYLNKIHQGFGLMFLLQTVMFYSALAILMRTSEYLYPRAQWSPIILLVLPLYPQILIYNVMVTKDVQCTASFLLTCALLAYYTVSKQRLQQMLGLILIILLYGTAIKFQAKYCAIIPSLWLGWLIRKKLCPAILYGLLIYSVLLGTISLINNLLTSNKDNNSWQYVKLYDLAAISLKVKQDLLPQFNKTEQYSFNSLEEKFGYPGIDSLVFTNQPLLKITLENYQILQLQSQWQAAIKKYPFIYLSHRLNNMYYMLIARPGYGTTVTDTPFTIINTFSNHYAYIISEYTLGSLSYLVMSHLPVIILGIIYIAVALYNWSKPSAQILLGLTLTAILMVILVFFMSMAGTPRYTYFAITLIHSAHIFAYITLNTQSKKPLAS